MYARVIKTTRTTSTIWPKYHPPTHHQHHPSPHSSDQEIIHPFSFLRLVPSKFCIIFKNKKFSPSMMLLPFCQTICISGTGLRLKYEEWRKYTLSQSPLLEWHDSSHFSRLFPRDPTRDEQIHQIYCWHCSPASFHCPPSRKQKWWYKLVKLVKDMKCVAIKP